MNVRRKAGRGWRGLLLATALVCQASGCTSVRPVVALAAWPVVVPAKPPFSFERDTLAFANELYWEYLFDDVTGVRETRVRPGPVTFGNRCAPMARAIRQFRDGARFDPEQPALADEAYRELVRRVLDGDPRSDGPVANPVVIPGYVGLREFSRAHERLLKEELGGRAESFLQRGNLRIVFPFLSSQQRDTATALIDALNEGALPILHLVMFPTTELNHTVVVFAAEETPREIRYQTVDPNAPDAPVPLVFERAAATFHFPRTHYFAGGPVHAFEIYRGPF